MQKPSELPAVSADARLYERLFLIADLCANCWGVEREAIETFPVLGEREEVARMAAIAIARELMRTRSERLALHFGGDSVTTEAALSAVSERSERDYDFRLTMRFLRSACAVVLGSDLTNRVDDSPDLPDAGVSSPKPNDEAAKREPF